jgi:hypothetical protein
MSSVEEIEAAIESLPPDDYERIVRWFSERDRPNPVVSAPGPGNGGHSILELRGLGKEIWAGVDPDRYVDEERSSWKD